MSTRTLSRLDHWLSTLDQALRTLSGSVSASRPTPMPAAAKASGHVGQTVAGSPNTPLPPTPAQAPLDEAERRASAALMRVNHVGEVCAQALYQAQALTARSPELRAQMLHAAQEELDHLVWTQQRLNQLQDRASLLNPLWYAGAFAMGLAAGRAGDAVSLGFVVETERQVEEHLAGHLERLPARDAASRAIVEQMRQDEARHGREARQAGGAPLPPAVQLAMRAAARVMTTTAHRI
ncbi:MAG: 2-polyprenyl-3-methyl-6-methoxy-1,4-benzoquinone monooxygenase [Betaproteobacteria bacterium]|nr:2-polyprenyl-3-methyl-6-methoxy-1,4-benzoquinone monooxygenase [Betaproteobacteria bacterium]